MSLFSRRQLGTEATLYSFLHFQLLSVMRNRRSNSSCRGGCSRSTKRKYFGRGLVNTWHQPTRLSRFFFVLFRLEHSIQLLTVSQKTVLNLLLMRTSPRTRRVRFCHKAMVQSPRPVSTANIWAKGSEKGPSDDFGRNFFSFFDYLTCINSGKH